jgi:hypothetical protein
MMKTKRTITVMMAFILMFGTGLMAGCIPEEGIKGDGNVVKEERNVSDFTSLEVGGAFTVYLYQGNKESLTIEADKNLMEFIRTEVKGDRLKIYTEDKSINKFTKMNIYLTFVDLEMIDVSGAADLLGKGKMQFKDLTLEASGASELEMELEVDMLRADFSGASEVELMGKAGSVRCECSGASEFDALDFMIKHGEFDVSGASDAKVNVSDMLEVEVSGAASLKYKGSPQIKSDVSGAASLRSY